MMDMSGNYYVGFTFSTNTYQEKCYSSEIPLPNAHDYNITVTSSTITGESAEIPGLQVYNEYNCGLGFFFMADAAAAGKGGQAMITVSRK